MIVLHSDCPPNMGGRPSSGVPNSIELLPNPAEGLARIGDWCDLESMENAGEELKFLIERHARGDSTLSVC